MEEWARPDYTLSDAELLEKLKEEIGDRSTKKEAGIIRAHENYNLPRSTSRITGPESGNLRVVSSQPGSSNVGKGSSRGVISRWSSLSKGKKIGVGIGVGIAGIWAANRIFGKDDYYNTIEGLPELGMAAQQRHILTDFGSGYQGPNPWLSPEYNQAEETPHLELMRASQLGKSKSELVKYFTQKEHASEYLLATSSAGTALHLVEETKKQAAGQTSSVEQFVYDPVHRVTGHIDFTDPSGNPVDIKTLAPERMNRVKSWGAFPKHVSQLNFYMAQLGASEGTLEYINRENTESRKKIVVPFSQELLDADISRMESARAEVEAGISSGKWERSQLPRGASLETLREGANSEKAELERNAGRLGYLKDVYSQEMSYLHGLEGNRFSAKDDAFNTIEGLSHKGIAQKKRHELTEFGSGWMPNPMAVLETLDDIAYTARRAGYWTWGGLGQGISNTYSQFSGKDDEYNTIEGLKHGGWAQQKRRQMTDFGSGWTGILGKFRGSIGSITGNLSKFMAKGGSGLLHPVEAAKMASGKSVEAFAESLGGKSTIIRQDTMDIFRDAFAASGKDINKIASVGISGTEGNVHMVVPRVQEEWKVLGMKAGLSEEVATKAVQHEDFLKTLLYHEHLEKSIHTGFSKTRKMASHLGGQVILGEAGFVSQLQSEEVKQLFGVVRTSTKVAWRSERQIYKVGLEAFGEKTSVVSQKLTSDFVQSSRDLKRAQSFLSDVSLHGGHGHTKMAGGRSVVELSPRHGGG